MIKLTRQFKTKVSRSSLSRNPDNIRLKAVRRTCKNRCEIGSRKNSRHLAVAVAILAIIAGCSKNETPPPLTVNPNGFTGEEKLVSSVIASEDLLLDLSPRISAIASKIQQPDTGSNPFSNLDRVVGIRFKNGKLVLSASDTKPDFVQIADMETVAITPDGKSPWAQLDELEVKWETIKFGVLSTKFTGDDQTRFRLETKAEGRGSEVSSPNRMFGIKGHQELIFQWQNSQWQLVEWIQQDFRLLASSQTLFEDVLPEVLPDQDALSKATTSYKDEILVKWSKRGQISLPKMDVQSWVELSSNHIFPSVSVVDYNNDGHDDLFLTARWGPTQMLKNCGDGTFEDVAEKIGLLEPYMVNSVLFADLDNDGDKDAIMTRPMETAKYLRNDSGKYVDVTDSHSDLGQQYFISSATVSDVNRDGLLDVYLTSYVPLQNQSTRFEDRFLGSRERSLFLDKVRNSDTWVNTAGASSVMLINRGEGKLERVPYDDLLSQWRRSFQATWADIDDDGDDDLYVCTDFAPNALLRNDTPVGAAQPVFTRADNLLVDGQQGFSMGGSWGDFDSDGDLDLYVSNMYSKAGRRILSQVEAQDPRLIASAAGNFLFENVDGKFIQKAGGGDGEFAVDKVGWSWGGQWSDFDNDGDLDLYVPSGFYTAPQQINGEVDT